jgi:integrase
MPRQQTVPSLRRHRPTAQGVVTLNGHDHYLGTWPANMAAPPPAVQARYDALIAEWLAAGRSFMPPSARPAPPAAPGGCSVAELVLAFMRHAEVHYREDGKPTTEQAEFRWVLTLLNRHFGTLDVREFGPLKLRALREVLVSSGLARTVINQRAARVVRAFKWGVGVELVPPDVYVALRAVGGLQRGRTAAHETEPVRPVDPGHLDRVIEKAGPVVACLLRFMRHTGCRPGEAVILRPCDLDKTGPVWWYRPARHKTRWRGKDRAIAVGPRAQEALNDVAALWGGEVPEGTWLFSPQLARRLRHVRMRAARRSKVQASQQSRAKARPEKAPCGHYSTRSLAQAAARACKSAGVPRFGPNRIRHLVASEVRHAFGLEAAQVVLGHAKADITQVYARRDNELAGRVASEVG